MLNGISDATAMGSSMQMVKRRYEEPDGLFSTMIPLAQIMSGVQTITPSIVRPCSFDSRHRGSLMPRMVREFVPLIKHSPLLIKFF